MRRRSAPKAPSIEPSRAAGSPRVLLRAGSFPPDDAPRLFIIGNFEVKNVYNLRASAIESDLGLRRRFSKTAHFLRRSPDQELVLVEGNRSNSRLLKRALPIGDSQDDLLADFASFGYQGSVQRAVGHWVRGDTAMASLEAWLTAGPASLIENGARMFCVSSSAIGLTSAPGSGDLAISHEAASSGDWILACSGEGEPSAILLARINHCRRLAGIEHALSSLFWLFQRGAPMPPELLPASLRQRRTIGDRTVIRGLVSWFSAHYRIGRFLDGAHDVLRGCFTRSMENARTSYCRPRQTETGL